MWVDVYVYVCMHVDVVHVCGCVWVGVSSEKAWITDTKPGSQRFTVCIIIIRHYVALSACDGILHQREYVVSRMYHPKATETHGV